MAMRRTQSEKESTLDPSYFIISDNISESSLDCEEPEDFIQRISGIVSVLREEERSEEVARYIVFQTNLEAAASQQGYGPVTVLDGDSRTSAFTELFESNDDGEFAKGVIRTLDEPLMERGSIFILDRLEILPAYRGLGLGARIIRNLVQRYAHLLEVVAIKPFPLQNEATPPSEPEDEVWRRKLALESFPSNHAKANKTLKAYYGGLGFRTIRGTPLMATLADTLLAPLSQNNRPSRISLRKHSEKL